MVLIVALLAAVVMAALFKGSLFDGVVLVTKATPLVGVLLMYERDIRFIDGGGVTLIMTLIDEVVLMYIIDSWSL
jgi:hypothetical protein